MAKGMRSKGKRANRAALRETLTKPIIKQRTEKIAQTIKDGLKKGSGSTIASLKKAFGVSGSSSAGKISVPVAPAVEVDDDDMDVDDEKEKKTQSQAAKEEFITKKKGSKPRHNPGKELVWF